MYASVVLYNQCFLYFSICLFLIFCIGDLGDITFFFMSIEQPACEASHPLGLTHVNMYEIDYY